jgi:tetratricopeptide (TPR) repeat protein
MRSISFAVLACGVLGISSAAFAAGGGGGGGTGQHAAQGGRSEFRAGKGPDRSPQLRAGLAALQQVVAKDPRNADAYNLLGYATRKSGNPTGSLQYYNQALQIDPKHLGAHEYVGEAYLMLDQPQQAELYLARLNSLCVFGCTEYRMLKAAIADYKAGKKPTN